KRTIATAEAYTMLFGNIIDVNRQQSIDNSRDAACCVLSVNDRNTNPNSDCRPSTVDCRHNIVDEVVVAIFRAPHSFTGENTVEISCHGSIYIQQEILRLLISAGARMAGPGEFTQRAFLNGRLDLSQAEAVADLINAQSAAAHTIALNQMRGNFSSKLEELRRQLLHFVSLLELELDFGDHDDLEFADRTELNSVANEIRSQLTRLQQTFSQGNAIKNGIPVAIVGETNAGKSTLLNLLVGDNRAIVSDIHGTTRDVIEDTVNINGLTFRFIDTAGIRQTSDIIENLGIERTYEMIERAQIILWVIDSTNVTEHIEWLAERIMRRTQGKRLIILLNKIDRLNEEELNTLRQWFEPYKSTVNSQQSIVNSRDARLVRPSEKSVKSDERLLAQQESESNDNEEKISKKSVLSVGDKIAGEATANSVNQRSLSLWRENSVHSVREKNNSVRETTPQILEISAKQNLNTECLTSLLYENAQMPDLSAGDIIISNLRHYEALTLALDSIDRVIEGLQMGIPADFVAQDIRQALFHLAEITGGEITTDEVLGNIFAHFCIGK
ncbi:MAG: tRNA uridine-5-carboxymethylaminomethyl(34) synthesis GTPase MnmE, partial [Paludibacteraceae bacterium]|nr:tRNA uridine-5-carboxymethylaminomethyl(34) synthesis GTPase MnmE [Paludibacteraceae bacterium]